MDTNELGVTMQAIMDEIFEIQTKDIFYDNVGVSIDFIDHEWVYGITLGGILEQDFGSIEELKEGLQEFAKNRLD